MKSFSLFGWTLVRNEEVTILHQCAIRAAKIEVIKKHLQDRKELESIWAYLQDYEFKQDLMTAIESYKRAVSEKTVTAKIEKLDNFLGLPVRWTDHVKPTPFWQTFW